MISSCSIFCEEDMIVIKVGRAGVVISFVIIGNIILQKPDLLHEPFFFSYGCDNRNGQISSCAMSQWMDTIVELIILSVADRILIYPDIFPVLISKIAYKFYSVVQKIIYDISLCSKFLN